MEIHPTAVVSPRAELARDVRVGPYAVVEEHVQVGEGCEIGAHAVVKRFTKHTPVNTVAARRRIADAMIKANRYMY